jgi:glycosyltransferase involved in cell wall biosynthesis
MACGAPVVARDTPYNREVLGIDAPFVAPSSDSIVAGVHAVMSDPKVQERLSLANTERALLEYSWSDVCNRYEKALLALLK